MRCGYRSLRLDSPRLPCCNRSPPSGRPRAAQILARTTRRTSTIPLLEWHGPGGPAGLQNRPGVATPRLLGSTPGPLRASETPQRCGVSHFQACMSITAGNRCQPARSGGHWGGTWGTHSEIRFGVVSFHVLAMALRRHRQNEAGRKGREDSDATGDERSPEPSHVDRGWRLARLASVDQNTPKRATRVRPSRTSVRDWASLIRPTPARVFIESWLRARRRLQTHGCW